MTDSSVNDELSHVFAHILAAEDGFRLRRLGEHLAAVAELAGRFAGPFGGADWARLAARWHDLGKFRPAFQRYLRRETGYDEGAFRDAPVTRTEHSIVGAVHAVETLDRAVGRVLAYLIAGHHAGLPDWYTAEAGRASLEVRLAAGTDLYQEMRVRPDASNALSGPRPSTRPPSDQAVALWLRMLFSCLVDADWLDTEGFLSPQRANARSGFPSLGELRRSFDRHVEALEEEVRRNGELSHVNRTRSEVRRCCVERAALGPGLFSLTVPTGGGKTLSSMAFALNHALHHRMQRIIYVIPYTSIIEQTADEFRKIFGEAVVEHHSNLDTDQAAEMGEVVDPARLRTLLATENWDAPVIVTTAVQFFESLFAARPRRVRKLHNIVGSVVVLDEVQLLPPDFLAPIIHVLEQLTSHFRVTALLMTATQPALEDRKEEDFHFRGLKGVRELITDPEGLHHQLKRVAVSVPADLQVCTSWEDVAAELLDAETVLCIVNTRRDCHTLWGMLAKKDQEVIHLSGLMCGAHLAAKIVKMRSRLKHGTPTRVVSTQLIEAGVDVDFPVVYRALAGLDSIAQAAGRCNREGNLDAGRVVVFVPPRPAPAGHLRMAQACGRQILQDGAADPLAPACFTRFFRELYWKHGPNLDRHRILDDLRTRPELDFRFRTAASKFRIIDDSWQASVIVRYGDDIERLLERLEYEGPSRGLFRKLQRRIVNIPVWHRDRMLRAGTISEAHAGVFVQEDTAAYSDKLGLLVELDDVRDPETLFG